MEHSVADLWQRLTAAVRGGGTAIRCTTQLTPAGGPGDKVFPPTFRNERGHTVYATETRLIDGHAVECVLLDSVPSQANRLELALLTAQEHGEIPLPLLATHVAGYGRVTVLEAPHRVYDAIFRDSTFDGVPFRQSALGQRLVAARPQQATALYQYCPTVLLLGGWDSHAGDSGRGTKMARALTSKLSGSMPHQGCGPPAAWTPWALP